MKVNHVNSDHIKSNDNAYYVKRKSKSGKIILSCLVALPLVLSACSSDNVCEDKKNDTSIFSKSSDIECDIPLDYINEMNIILNDDDCSDKLFGDICNYLKQDRIEFTVAKDSKNINIDNSIIITFDQQYSSGANTLFFAPFDNARLGNSDSLSLAMKSAFEQNGFFTSDILCAQVGFDQDSNGNVSYNVPTKTEKAIESDTDASFVTISFGTQNVNAEWIAKSIENGLTRYYYYLDNYDQKEDLIYRASIGESLDMVADYFGSDAYTLKTFNNISNNSFSESQAIVNPNVKEIDAFGTYAMFKIGGKKTRAY